MADLVIPAGILKNMGRLNDEIRAALPSLANGGFSIDRDAEGNVTVRVFHGDDGPPVTAQQIQTIIAAHDDTLPPKTVEQLTGIVSLRRNIRTTDATPTQLFRVEVPPKTLYDAQFRLRGIDANNGVIKRFKADILVKRLSGNAIRVGVDFPPPIADSGAPATTSGVASWNVDAEVSGVDFYISVTGFTGRTIDWLLSGEIETFTPE